MKRLLAILLVLASLFFILPVSAADTAEKPIEVYYLGKKLEFPVPPQLIGNTTMVPMRTIFEALGYTIDWDSTLKKVTGYRDEDTISLKIGESSATVNSKTVPLETAPVLYSSNTLIPLRFIGEASGCDVSWNAAERSVTLSVGGAVKAALLKQQNALIDDLQKIKNDLPMKHKNLFFYKSKKSFNDEMESLIKNVATLDKYQVKLELMKIINSVNDPHTAVNIESSGFGLKFFQFENDIYLIDGPELSANYIGHKLTAINQVSIQEIRKRLSPVLPIGNESYQKEKLCQILDDAAFYLRAIGVTKSTYEPVTYVFDNGSLKASQSFKNLPLMSFLPGKRGNYPLYYVTRGLPYSYTLLKDDTVMYVKYNSCANILTYPFTEFTADVFSTLERKNITTLVLDLRDNGGGNSNILDPFLKEVVKRSTINSKGHFYVIVGRKTFSAAVQNVVQLKQNTHCILVGEPTGESPNQYGKASILSFNNLNLTISFSTEYIQAVADDVATITPDIVATPKAAAFFAGKDDFLEAVFVDTAK